MQVAQVCAATPAMQCFADSQAIIEAMDSSVLQTMSDPCESHTVWPPLPRQSSATTTQDAFPAGSSTQVSPPAHGASGTQAPFEHLSRLPAPDIEHLSAPTVVQLSASGAASEPAVPLPPAPDSAAEFAPPGPRLPLTPVPLPGVLMPPSPLAFTPLVRMPPLPLWSALFPAAAATAPAPLTVALSAR